MSCKYCKQSVPILEKGTSIIIEKDNRFYIQTEDNSLERIYHCPKCGQNLIGIYDLEWLKERIEMKGENPNYIFFWYDTSRDVRDCAILSQWSKSPFNVNGETFVNTEQWMMSRKALMFKDKEIYDKIMRTANPAEMKSLGRKIRNFDAPTWDSNAMKIVIEGNIHKFTSNKDLKEYLLSTGDAVLVEASPFDKIWGIGMEAETDPNKWQGKNQLGFSLMTVRDILRGEQTRETILN